MYNNYTKELKDRGYEKMEFIKTHKMKIFVSVVILIVLSFIYIQHNKIKNYEEVLSLELFNDYREIEARLGVSEIEMKKILKEGKITKEQTANLSENYITTTALYQKYEDYAIVWEKIDAKEAESITKENMSELEGLFWGIHLDMGDKKEIKLSKKQKEMIELSLELTSIWENAFSGADFITEEKTDKIIGEKEWIDILNKTEEKTKKYLSKKGLHSYEIFEKHQN